MIAASHTINAGGQGQPLSATDEGDDHNARKPPETSAKIYIKKKYYEISVKFILGSSLGTKECLIRRKAQQIN